MWFKVGTRSDKYRAKQSPGWSNHYNYSKIYWLSTVKHWKSKNKGGPLILMQVLFEIILKNWILTKEKFTSYPLYSKKWNWGPFITQILPLHFWIKLYSLLRESHLTFADKALWIVFRNSDNTHIYTLFK